MSKPHIFLNDWLDIHPYAAVQPSDTYFVRLANRLYDTLPVGIPEEVRMDLSLFSAAYLEDVISGLGLWDAFVEGHYRLYGSYLPFYDLGSGYERGCINEEDVRFIIWNTVQKAMKRRPYPDPLSEEVVEQAQKFYRLLDEAYEEAPENPLLENYFSGFSDADEAEAKLEWLYGCNYLIEPSVRMYSDDVTGSDRMTVPVGPLALFLYEWIDLLTDGKNGAWKQVDGLYWQEPEVPAEIRAKNAEMYRSFVGGTEGRHIVYLSGYGQLRRFLTGVLGWPDDDDHTLPQMKSSRDFVLMAEPEKGILLARDVCSCIADPANPL